MVVGGQGTGFGAFIACLLLVLAAPGPACAQQAPRPVDGEAIRREVVTIDAVCVTDGAGARVRALARLRDSPRAATTVAEGLLDCIGSDSDSSRPMLVVNYLEAVRRADLLRLAVLRASSPGARLRAQVALANIEGDYGALALAIGEAVGQGATAADIRHALSYLLPPSGLPESEVEAHGRDALRAWLDHFGLLEGSVWADAGGERG
jgi:hypothetical protein